MGRKNKRKGHQKNKKHQQPLPPLSEEFKQNLYLEALEGINKMKQSKDLFMAKVVKEAFILSKWWLDAWKIHVGYDAVLRGEQPCGRKYGRQQIQEINKDLVANEKEFHSASETHYYLDPPLKDVQPVKDYILITQDVWQYFAEKYKGIEIRRVANEKGEFELKLISPYIIFLMKEKITKILSFNSNQLANKTDLVGMLRMQMPSEWVYKDLVIYCSQYMEAQNLQIWQMNPIFEHAQIKLQLLKTLNSQKNILLGEQLIESELNNFQLKQFLKQNSILVVAENDIEFSEMEFKFELNQGGCCFACGSKSQLNYCCACKKVFYCSDTCRYKDQEFHSKFCVKAYDSQDDEDFDLLKYDEIKNSKGAGLVNLGNTCYMNASLQSLLSSTHFQQFLSNKHYWTQNTQKRNIMIVYKLEKLLKNLMTHQKSFSPYGFRQQFGRKFPVFGNNFQQDAAEFILYLFDAMNEELCSNGNLPQQEVLLNLGDVDQPTEQISESEDDDSSEEQESTQKVEQQQQAKFNKKDNVQQQLNNDNFEQAFDQISKQNSSLINNNFLGITKSEVECPICLTKSFSYEQFLMLPLSLNAQCQQKNLVDVFVVYDDWFKPYEKVTFEFQPNQTLLMDLKREIGEKLNIIPSFLLGSICGSNMIETYLFHDEDPVSKIISDYQNGYFCLFQLDQDIYAVTDEDQYFDITVFSYEKKTAYSYQCENIPASIPKILVIKKSSTALQIYQKIWEKLGQFSHSEQIVIPEEIQQADLLTPQQVREALTYQIQIETRLGAKMNCPFTCGKSFKKEQKQHSCELPFNNSTTLEQYLDKLNYKNAHTSLLIEFQENATPEGIRIQFEAKVNHQTKEKQLNLEDLINNFQCKEPLIDENAYNCSVCNDLTFAIKTLWIQRWPDQLLIQLKRFQFNEHKGFQKNNIFVNYPENFNLNGINYQLYSVVQHVGQLENGHYYAYGLRNNQWYEFNDETVKSVSLNSVLNDKNAYILFYQQK